MCPCMQPMLLCLVYRGVFSHRCHVLILAALCIIVFLPLIRGALLLALLTLSLTPRCTVFKSDYCI